MKTMELLKKIYSPQYIILNVAFAAMYYMLIMALLSAQQAGAQIYTPVPAYLLYLLAASSSIPLTLAMYSIRNTRRNAASISATATGSVMAISGGIISGCACQASALSAALSILVGSGQALYLSTVVQSYALYIFSSMIMANVAVTAYYLNKFSSPSCAMQRGKGR